jgi:hypothetical protein
MSTAPAITIATALRDRNLLGAALGDVTTWLGWVTILMAAFALGLKREQAQFLASVSGGRSPPANRCKEAWFIVGRRSGKSRVAAAIAIFLACFRRYSLSPGEVGYVLVVSKSLE